MSRLAFLYAKQFISFDFGVKYNRKWQNFFVKFIREKQHKKDYFIRLLRENYCFRYLRLPLVFNTAFANLIFNEGKKVLHVKRHVVFKDDSPEHF